MYTILNFEDNLPTSEAFYFVFIRRTKLKSEGYIIVFLSFAALA